MQQFASDNNAGICPEAMAALVEANAGGHVLSYGDDPWTERATAAIRHLLGTEEVP
jgi:threonine aldolase